MPFPKLLITAGLAVAQIAMGMLRTIEGPRLKDLEASMADYGTPLPNVLGTRRVSVPCMFCEPIKERKRTRKTKGGKYKEYTYFGTWASVLADHEIQRVRRIWFDKHLVYDVTGGSTDSVGDGTDVVEDLVGDNVSLADLMRIYLGTEDQEPDPRMLATIEANEGAGTCPAYKGVAYILFEDVPLEKIGNRFPQVEVELDGIGGSPAFIEITSYPDDPDATNAFFVQNFSPNGRYGVGRISSQTVQYVDLDDPDHISGTYPPSSLPTVDVTLIDNDGTIYALDIVPTPTLYKIEDFGAGAITTLTTTFPATPSKPAKLFIMPDDSRKIAWDSSANSNAYIYDVDSGVITTVTNPDPPWTIQIFRQDSYGDVWAIGTEAFPDQEMVHLWRVIDNGAGSAAPDHFSFDIDHTPVGGFFVLDAVHTTGGWLIVWAAGEKLVLLDEDDFSILASRGYLGDNHGFLDDTLGHKWLEATPPGLSEIWLPGFEDGLGDSVFVRISSVDLTSLASLRQDSWAIGAEDIEGETIYYVPYLNGILSTDETNPADTRLIIRLLPTDDDAGLNLGTVIRHFSGLVDLTEDTDYTITTAAAAISMVGYSYTQGPAKASLEWLLDIYDCEAQPHDGIIRFNTRGPAPGATLVTPEFVVDEGRPEGRFKLTVSNDTDIPRRVVFNFADVDNDQQPNNVTSQRRQDGVDGVGELTIDGTTLALDGDDAQQLVDRYFRRKWFSRISGEFRLTSQRLAIEPGDFHPVDFDGLTVNVHVDKVKHSADGSLHVECSQDEQALAARSDGVGSPAFGRPPSEIFAPGESAGYVLDIPLTSDAHDQVAPFVYVVAGPVDPDAQYFGTEFYQSDTGEADTFEPGFAATGSSDPMTWGATTTELSDAVPHVLDNGSTLTVVLSNGTLSSITEDAMLASATANLALIGDEFVQFKTATLTAPLTYALSGFVRGARGTEQHMSAHAIGDRFVLLDGAVALRTIGAGELGDTDYYIPAGVGSNPDAANEIELEFSGAAHRPYSPVHGTLSQDGADWEISATRRTRIGGASVNGQDVPLGETSESWEADIMDGADVVRTLAGTSLPLIYTDAMAVLDFGSSQSSLDVNLYQMSPVLTLRGFPLAIAA